MIHWSVIYLISEWVIRLVMLVYVPRQRNAAASRTWLLLIFLLPWPGLLFYGLVGRIYLPKYRIGPPGTRLQKNPHRSGADAFPPRPHGPACRRM